jgi:hypothetical protein
MQGLLARSFFIAGGSDGEPAVLDGDMRLVAGTQAGLFDLWICKSDPRKKRRLGLRVNGPEPLLLNAPRLLDGDEPFGTGGRVL